MCAATGALTGQFRSFRSLGPLRGPLHLRDDGIGRLADHFGRIRGQGSGVRGGHLSVSIGSGLPGAQALTTMGAVGFRWWYLALVLIELALLPLLLLLGSVNAQLTFRLNGLCKLCIAAAKR